MSEEEEHLDPIEAAQHTAIYIGTRQRRTIFQCAPLDPPRCGAMSDGKPPPPKEPPPEWLLQAANPAPASGSAAPPATAAAAASSPTPSAMPTIPTVYTPNALRPRIGHAHVWATAEPHPGVVRFSIDQMLSDGTRLRFYAEVREASVLLPEHQAHQLLESLPRPPAAAPAVQPSGPWANWRPTMAPTTLAAPAPPPPTVCAMGTTLPLTVAPTEAALVAAAAAPTEAAPAHPPIATSTSVAPVASAPAASSSLQWLEP